MVRFFKRQEIRSVLLMIVLAVLLLGDSWTGFWTGGVALVMWELFLYRKEEKEYSDTNGR
ncbi:hypothetical protein U0355_09795 [Salimicrobium sp. PL1-032A]|uniref:hypothetical protein n=1 Tax=Salimicrobium sp. PL1-032A TaxID=3095364 RepID=UPI003261127A